MAWIKIEAGVRNHPKVALVARDCGVSIPQALGHIVALWCWTLDTQPDGCLSQYDDESIEVASMWGGDAGVFVSALRNRKLLDDGNHIHDWMEHAGSLRTARYKAALRVTDCDRQRQSVTDCDRQRQIMYAEREREKEKEKEKRKSTSKSKDLAASDEKPVAALPPSALSDLPLYAKDAKLCNRWNELLTAWTQANPGVDIMAEVRKAHAWEVANPQRRKRDRPAFLGRWLAREQDSAGKGHHGQSPPQGRFERNAESVRQWLGNGG